MKKIQGFVIMNGRGNLAKMMADGFDEVIAQLENIEGNVIKIFKDAVFSGSGIVAGEIQKRLEQNLESPRSASLHGGKFDRKTTKFTGDLLDSFGIAPTKENGEGGADTKVGFHGYDSKGVANQLKARAMESGTSTLKKRPFVRPAINKCRKRVQETMGNTLKAKLAELQMKG